MFFLCLVALSELNLHRDDEGAPVKALMNGFKAFIGVKKVLLFAMAELVSEIELNVFLSLNADAACGFLHAAVSVAKFVRTAVVGAATSQINVFILPFGSDSQIQGAAECVMYFAVDRGVVVILAVKLCFCEVHHLSVEGNEAAVLDDESHAANQFLRGNQVVFVIGNPGDDVVMAVVIIIWLVACISNCLP